MTATRPLTQKGTSTMTVTEPAIFMTLMADRERRIRESWATQVVCEAETVKFRVGLDAQRAEQSGGHAELMLAKQVQAQVEELLTEVRAETIRRKRFAWPIDTWTGRSIESAFGALHAAKLAALAICTQDELSALMPDILARIQRWLPTADPRRQKFEQFVVDSATHTTEAQQREIVRAALQVIYQRQDQAQRGARQFRNVLLAAGGVTIILTTVFLLLVTQAPGLVPFCFAPGAGQAMVCPSGGSGPQWTDGLVVAGMGLLGGTFATTWTIRRMRPNGTPYGIPLALATLKVPCGALTALCAILLIHGHFVPGFTAIDSPPQILAYSLLFGFAQQAVTGAIDARAGELGRRTFLWVGS